MNISRFDTSFITGKMEKTPEGFYRGNVTVTRTGIFEYRNADGTIRRELRLPEEVFAPESIETLKMIPVTNLHPMQFVNSDNAHVLSIGATGENASRDDQLLNIPITVTHKQGIDSIDAGRRQLSLGYNLELEPTPGVYNGQNYDAIQRKIRYNHLALVDAARAGSVASLRIDSQDAIAVEYEMFPENKNMDGGSMKVMINGVEVEVNDLVGSHIAAINNRADAAEKDACGTKAKSEKMQAELDEANDKLQKSEEKVAANAANSDSEDKIVALAKSRAELLVSASKRMNADEYKLIADKPDREIMVAVIAKARPGFNADGKSLDYIKARHDSIVEDDQPANPTDSQSTFNADSSQARKPEQNNDEDHASAYQRQLDSFKPKA